MTTKKPDHFVCDKKVGIHVVGDYGSGDIAFAEVVTRLKAHLPNAEILSVISVRAFNTVETGFCVSRLAMAEIVPENMVVFHNCAPRKDASQARKNNEGEGLAHTLLPNGVQVIGVNSGYSFSLIKNYATAIHLVNCATGGSQFRSRDVFPEALAKILAGKADMTGKNVQDMIPKIPENSIAYIDGFGNIKTTVLADSDAFQPGAAVKIKIGNQTEIAQIAGGSFHVQEGELAFSPGSSTVFHEGKRVALMEVFRRGGRASDAFIKAVPGGAVSFELVHER